MAQSIKIKYSPKSKLLLSAKPGELKFGKYSSLVEYSPPKGIELRLLQAEANLRKTNELVKKAPKNRSIKTMLIELKRTRAIKQSAWAQRMALLLNYNALLQAEKKAVTSETAEKIKKRAELVAKKVENLEALIKNSTELETRIQNHLTLALSQEVKIKKKKTATITKRELTQREKEDADGLLDTKTLYEKRIARINKEIKSGKLSTSELIDRRLSLTDARLSLKHTNQLLRDLTKPLQKQGSKRE
jgi:NADH dehydrogenase/NADH:ubiquinone oxidoreductase subunit G